MPIRVNNQLLDDKAIREEARTLREQLRLETPSADTLTLELRAREWAQENAIMRTLVQQAAGTGSGDELLDSVMAKVSRPTQAEIAAHYRQFAQTFYVPETLRAAHIVKNVDETATEEQAQAAILGIADQIKQGADFAELADRHSDCPGDGGDLGFFAQGEMVPEFDRIVFAMRPGEVSPVFRSLFGFHIAKVLERRPPRTPSLNEVRQRIEQELWSRKKTRAANNFVQALRSKAEIRRS